jgi:hypothetical protein
VIKFVSELWQVDGFLRVRDPIEANSLGEFFKEYMPEEPEGRKPLKIGSVKTNIGHLESAAGVAGTTNKTDHHDITDILLKLA